MKYFLSRSFLFFIFIVVSVPSIFAEETPKFEALNEIQDSVLLEAISQTDDLKEIKEPDVIYVPTPQYVVEKMLKMAKVKKDDVVYDLGCGDGRIIVTAAKKYGCKGYGFDIDPKRVKESRENVKKNKVGHLVHIEQKDIFTLDLSKADVITLYLLPSLNVKLIPQLEKLKSGSRIVSHDFDMKGAKPDKVVKVTEESLKKGETYDSDDSEIKNEHTIYLWTVPLKKEKEVK